MDLEKIKKRIECCVLVEEEKISWDVTKACSEEVLIKNMKCLIQSGKCAEFRSFHKNSQASIMSMEEYTEYIVELMKIGVSAQRIEHLLKEMPLEALVAGYSTDEAGKVLQNERIAPECMEIYLKYYLHDELSTDEVSGLSAGVKWFRNKRKSLTDDWIGEIGEKRKLMTEPIITEGCLNEIRDIDWCMKLLVENEPLCRLLATLYRSGGYCVRPDDTNVEEMAEEAGRLLQLWHWAESFFSEYEIRRLLPLWLGNHALAYDLEFLKKKLESGVSVDKEAFLSGRASYIAFLYNESVPAQFDHVHEELVIYAVSHRKKAFLRLLREHADLYREIPSSSVLFCRQFYEKSINLNTLNVKNLSACRNMPEEIGGNWEFICGKGYTFDEVALIYGLSVVYVKFYGNLSVLRTDDRIRVMREIIRGACLDSKINDEKVADMVIQKPLSEWMRQDFGHIRDLTGKNAVGLLGVNEDLAHLIPDLHSDAEARYVMANARRCKQCRCMEEVRETAVDQDEEWKYLSREFGFTDAFVAENKERISHFIFCDGAHIFKSYYDGNRKMKEALRRLVSAELMGRFRELKYFRDDLNKEIDYPITERQKKAWMENTKRTEGQFSLWEEDGLIPVMKMGVMPYKTCLSYEDGAYRQCLLACHDSNKKVLYMTYEGKVVFRAAVRLTKGTFQENAVSGSEEKKLHFADLEAYDKGIGEGHEETARREYLTLFLERPYMAGLPEKEENKAFQMVIYMMQRKAENMDAVFVASMAYQKNLTSDLVPVNYSLYISKSKSGEQYLDSLGGDRGVDEEGSYNRNPYLLEKRKIRQYSERMR